jgi:predicted dehydrogenase
MKKYKVLLLGASGIYGTTWYKEIAKVKNCELTGICASSMESFSKLPDVPGMSHACYDDVERAINECYADIAVIVLPTDMHARACELALERGLHIICEKPVASTIEEAARLCEEAKKYPKQKFMVAQNYRFRNHIRTLYAAVQNNVAGQLSNVLYEFRRRENLWGYRTNMELPLLKDVSIHHFDLMRYLTGKNCSEIYATAYKQPWCEFRDRASIEAIIKMEDDMVINVRGEMMLCYLIF